MYRINKSETELRPNAAHSGLSRVTCVCTKRVCVSNNEPKACTVGIYSTYESRYLYSLGLIKIKTKSLLIKTKTQT